MKEVAFEAVSFSVERVSCNRVSQALKVDSDLMGAPGMRHAGDECPSVTGGEELIVGHCIAP